MNLLREKQRALGYHPQVAAAMIGSAVIGGAVSSSASKSAANKQKDAANAATAQQGAMFDKTVDLNSPFRQAGVDATSKLSDLLGTSSGFDANAYLRANPDVAADPYWSQHPEQHFQQFGQKEGREAGFDANEYLRENPDVAADPYWSQHPEEHFRQFGQSEGRADPQVQQSPDRGSLLKPFGMSDFQLDPGIQFQTQQGNLALTNSMAAKDGVLSGGALKALIGYNQGMAGLGYQSAFDRYMAGKKFTLGSLMDVSKTGQAAASGVTSAAPSFSSGIAGTIQGAGNASAAGTIGSANAISGGVQGAGNGIFLNSLLNNQNSDFGGPVTTSANPGGVYTAPSAINTA